MKDLKGKCKTCFGCNKLEDENFEGIKKCENYAGMGVDKVTLLVILLSMIMVFIIIALIIISCINFNILCGE